MTTFLGFLLGITLGALFTIVIIAKVAGWMDQIVKTERQLFIKSENEKTES